MFYYDERVDAAQCSRPVNPGRASAVCPGGSSFLEELLTCLSSKPIGLISNQATGPENLFTLRLTLVTGKLVAHQRPPLHVSSSRVLEINLCILLINEN